MPSVADLALPLLPVELPAFAADPMPYIDEARREHPWLARCNAGYLVHGYQAVREMIYMDDKLGPARSDIVAIYGAQGTPWAQYMKELLNSQVGAEHSRLRSSVASAFTPRNINKHRTLMRKVVSELLDEWVPRGEFDFAQFAAHFPIQVLCGLLGVEASDIPPAFRKALATQAASLSLNRDLLPALLEGYSVQWELVDGIVHEREKAGAPDDGSLLDVLITAKNKGQINDREMRHLLMVLFAGGYDTTKNMLTTTMHLMLGRPDDWARCGEDQAFCQRVVEEMFRYSSITTPFRTVTQDFEYEGVQFPKGAILIFATLFAGRDPEAFVDPMEFRPDEIRTNRHVGFGRGAHMCLGQHLARTQLEEAVHLIPQRITHPRLAGKVAWRPFLGSWGPSSLPIRFEAP